jgi:hypothetical protein
MDDKNKVSAVYRFRDSVAVNIDGLGTLYMRPGSAKIVALALNHVADDIRQSKFHESTIATIRLDENGELE